MLKMVMMLMFVVLVSSAVCSDVTVVEQLSTEGGRDLGFCTRYGDLWGVGLDQKNPIIEIGKAVPVGKGCLGVYISYWSASREYFAEPFGLYAKETGNIRFKAKGFMYLPLNGGKAAYGSDEISLTYRLNKNVRAGGMVHFWKQEEESFLSASGLQVEWNLGDKTSLVFRKTNGDLGQTRLVIAQTF